MPGRLHLSRIALSFTFCGLWPLLAAAAPPEPANPEFAVRPLAVDTAKDLPPLDHEIEFGLHWLILSDDDLRGTYGGVPVAQIRYSVRPGPRARFFVGIGYGWTGGDPYYDAPTFEGQGKAKLQLVPLQMGVRLNLVPRDDFRLHLGFLAELVRIRETIPIAEASGAVAEVAQDGWAHGVGVTFGPEWRSRDLRRAIGFEAGLTASGGHMEGYNSRDATLTGASGRVYVTIRI